MTTIADDGPDDAGGWQQAKATLNFVRVDGSESWSCTITVGMPLRAKAVGVITKGMAANVSAAYATQSWKNLRATSPDLPPGIFCSKFKDGMVALFGTGASAGIGAKVNLN